MTRKVCVFDDSETIQNKDILSSDFGSGSETESMMDSEVELNNKHINTQNSFGILKNRKVMEIINDDATTAVDSGLGSEEEEKMICNTEEVKQTILNEYSSCVNQKHIKSEIHSRLFELPNYTIKEIKSAIPKHCWKREHSKSFYYVIHDYLLIALSFYLATKIHLIDNPLIRTICWISYWVCQGIFLTGTWVIAHECGHQSFSPKGWINDTVGFIMHSLLLVPYFSWKYTHGKHHKSTSHLTEDQVFIPWTRSKLAERDGSYINERKFDHNGHEESILDETPIKNLLDMSLMFLFGWPLYLYRNASGQKYPNYRGRVSHFISSSPIFNDRQRPFVILSAIGVYSTLFALSILAYNFGIMNIVYYYFIPYINVNFWLVFITYLQHTDPKLPHYREGAWTYVRGALCTIDRDYGFILNYLFHHINDTHVAHHLFSLIPHYHAEEVTECIKPIIEKHYLYENGPLFNTVFNVYKSCRFIEDEGDVVWFKN